MLSSENSGCMIAYSYIVLLFNWPAVNDRANQEGADALSHAAQARVRPLDALQDRVNSDKVT